MFRLWASQAGSHVTAAPKESFKKTCRQLEKPLMWCTLVDLW